MAADLEHPERVVGLHFFNPVAVLPLVELVRIAETDDATLATAYAVVKALRKRPVLVRDAPAFVVNRVLTRLTTVVLDALEHGNTVDETDEAILRLGLPMAPSVLLQMVGPRVANHVLETLHEAFPERFPLSPTLAELRRGPRRGRRRARSGAAARSRSSRTRWARRRRGPAPARGGRRREREGRRHGAAARRRLPVLARRDHEVPRPDGRLGARRRPAARRGRRGARA